MATNRRGIGLADLEPRPSEITRRPEPPPSSPPSLPSPTTAEPARPVLTPEQPVEPAQTRRQTEGERLGVPQFEDNPLAAIGFVLESFSAGMAGEELPATRLKREQTQRKLLELQQIEIGGRVLEQGLDLIGRTPREDRERVIDSYSSRFADTLPGLKQNLLQMSESLPDARDMAQVVGEFAPQLQALCGGDVECMRKHAGDPNLIKLWQNNRDNENIPIVGAKLREITQVIHTRPQIGGALARDSSGNFVLSFSDLDVLNESLPEPFKLNGSEMSTLRRNPQIMAAYGIRTPEIMQVEAEAAARARAKRRFEPPEIVETERDGQTFHTAIDRFSGRTLFEIPAGPVEGRNFDMPGFKAALSLRASGEALPEGAFAPPVEQAVAGMEPEVAANIRAGLDQGGMEIITNPDGSTEVRFGVSGQDIAARAEARAAGRERGKREEQAREQAAQFGVDIANIGSLLRKAHEMGEGATGLRGVAVEGLGGYFEQFVPGAGDRFSGLLDKVLGGETASPGDVAAFRAQARTAIAQNISTISGEESGRFTEMERRVTEQTMKVLETGASKPQITAAVGELFKLKVLLREFSFIKARLPSRWDFADREDQLRFVEDMQKFGLDPVQMKDLAVRIQELRSETRGIFE